MLYQVLQRLNHYYPVTYSLASKIESDGVVGSFTVDKFVVGQYVLIKNTLLNDGVYKIADIASNKLTLDATLTAENTGRQLRVFGLAIPKSLVDLAAEIKTYITNNPSNNNIASERLGDYSVSYKNNENIASGWYGAFQDRLSQYQRFYSDLEQFIATKTNYNFKSKSGW